MKEESNTEQDTLDEKYEVLNLLGDGATADVYLVKKLKENNDNKYAAKVLKKTDEHFNNEVDMLKIVSNPYITNLIDFGQGKLIRKGKVIGEKQYLVIENAEKGDLFSYIYYPQKGLGERIGKFIFQKILEGVQACHKAGVCHRDLKMENILVDGKYNPKICDFGFSTLIKGEDGSGVLKEPLGTRAYTAPEILKFKPYKGADVDVFSLGVVLLTLVTCKIGFCQATKHDPYYKYIMLKKYKKYLSLVKPSIPELDDLSEDFKNLYLKMVSYDPNSRPSIEDILEKDKWFDEIRNLSKEEKENLEKEVYSNFSEREEIVKEQKALEIEANEDDDEDKGGFRGVDGEFKEYFNDDLKPKFEKTGLNMNHYIKIKGDINPINYMNKLANAIYNENKDKCSIEESKKGLKFNVIFEKDQEKVEDDDDLAEELAKLELNDGPKGDNHEEYFQKQEITVQIKLFESYNGGYILRFAKKSGEIQDYYKTLDKIKELIKKIS